METVKVNAVLIPTPDLNGKSDGKCMQVLTNTVWLCPSCEGENPLTGKMEWCGKNLKCVACGEYHYYSEYMVKS